MIRHEDLAALEPVADALESLTVEFYIGGSVASSVHGVARATIDIDVVAALRREHIEPLVSRLQSDYYIEADQIRQAIEQRRSFNIIHLATMYKIDVFVMKDRPFDDVARRRTTRQTLSEDSPHEFSIASPEDTILNKLEWYSAGGEVSERQWTDLIGVMRVQQDDLDRGYLERWSGELGVRSLLNRAWAEVEGSGS
jgi:hypothetical protein